jgi:hypothetical protein
VLGAVIVFLLIQLSTMPRAPAVAPAPTVDFDAAPANAPLAVKQPSIPPPPPPRAAVPTCIDVDSTPPGAAVYGSRAAEQPDGLLGIAPVCLKRNTLVTLLLPGYYHHGWVMVDGRTYALRPVMGFAGTWRLGSGALHSFSRQDSEVLEYALAEIGGVQKLIARHQFKASSFISPTEISLQGEVFVFGNDVGCSSTEYRYTDLPTNIGAQKRESLEVRSQVCGRPSAAGTASAWTAWGPLRRVAN